MATDEQPYALRKQVRQRPVLQQQSSPLLEEGGEGDGQPSNSGDAFDESLGSAFLLANSTSTFTSIAARQHRRCWGFFLAMSCAVVLIFVVLVSLLLLREHHQMHDASASSTTNKKGNSRTLEYFVLC
ncbi:transmembrane protein, putative, partial [Bodo saltans]